jgi:hypothetical protein
MHDDAVPKPSILADRRGIIAAILGVLAALWMRLQSVSATTQGKRRKKIKKRWARRNARLRRRVGRQYEADCLHDATAPGLVCSDELAACCHHLRNLDIDAYCECLRWETCGSYCVE